MNKLKSLFPFSKTKVLTAVSVLLLSASAHAELPSAVNDAFDDAVVNIGIIGALALGAIVAAYAFKLLRKAM